MSRFQDGRLWLVGKIFRMRSKGSGPHVREHFIQALAAHPVCHSYHWATMSGHLHAALQGGPSNGLLYQLCHCFAHGSAEIVGLDKGRKQEIEEYCWRIGNHVKLLVKSSGSRKPRAASFVHLALSSCSPTQHMLNVTPGRLDTFAYAGCTTLMRGPLEWVVSTILHVPKWVSSVQHWK